MTAGTGRIACKNLWKVFGPDPSGALERLAGHPEAALSGHVAAVRDVSFSVEPGQTCVVMGLSGSGKSTLVRCLTRLIEPTAGSVAIDGEEVTRLSPRALRALRQAKLAMVFQHFGLFPHMTVVENVAYGLEVRGADRKTRRARAEEMIALVGLEGWEQAYPSTLSGGMQQRVGIARALAVEPEVLFFDEPFSALDPLIRNEMQAELVHLQARMHKTIVFITHDFAEAIRLGDRIAIMRSGRIEQFGTAQEIVAHPANGYVHSFSKEVPLYSVQTAEHAMTVPASADTEHRFRASGCKGAVKVHAPLIDLVDDALAQPCPVPVVCDDGRLVGELGRDAFLRAMRRRG